MNNCQLMPCLAISAAKLSSFLIRLSGAGMASNLPGKIAIKIYPHLLSYLSNELSDGCIAVTGTNGKSTTSGLLASILRAANYQIIHNRQGANLLPGITASLIDAVNLNGSLNANLGLFEVDEAALPLLAELVTCNTVVVTNLLRDQLDRYGELDKTANLITQGIKAKNSIAVLNADDPNVCNLPCNNKKYYYGLNYEQDLATDIISNGYVNNEISYCPLCGHEIKYEGYAGKWHCSQCAYTRPPLDLYASQIKLAPASSSFTINTEQESIKIDLPLPGLFNIYNAIAASTTSISLGIDLKTIKKGLESYETLFGRSENLLINKRTLIIQLIKNPAGTSHALNSLANSRCHNVLIAINDNLADGRDISWLWDANFEILKDIAPNFIVSGKRAQDMAVRLKYTGIESNTIVCQPNLSDALRQALERTPVNGSLWVLPTYTALLELQKILRHYKT